ncbi:MAG: hypothetical protein H6739_18195 [Alphaproteobacteria bacterium]|nr:hypothetical protein [Alphaproteobacteria bacterium]
MRRIRKILPLLALLACRDDGGDTAAPWPDGLVCPDPLEMPDIPDDRWSLADPAPGGDLLFIVAAPSNPSRVYTVSHHNGLHRSEDGGRTWRPGRTEVTHLAGQIAVHPTEPRLIAYCADTLYLSMDGGDDITRTALGSFEEGERVRGVAWRGDRLYAIDQDGDFFRSDDKGDSFTWLASFGRRHGGSGFHGLHDDWWALFPDGDDLIVAVHEGGIARLPGWEGQPETLEQGPIHLGTVGVEDGVIRYAVGEVARVIDGDAPSEVVGQAGAELTASIRAPDGTLWFFTEDRAWRVDDQGLVDAGPLPDFAHHAAFAARAGDALLLGHKDGVLRSTDDGTTWNDASEGMIDDDLSVVATHPWCEGLLYAGTQCERGLFTSLGWGDAMTHVAEYMHYVMEIRVSAARPAQVWVSTDDRVMRSDNLGYSWTAVLPEELAAHMHGLAVHPTDPDVVLVGSVGSGEYADDSGRVYRTDDGGLTWQPSADGLPQTEASMHAIHFVQDDPDVVLLGSYRAGNIDHHEGEGIGLFRSTDGGLSWAALDVPDRSVTHIAGCAGRQYATTERGVLRSTDQGERWSSVLETGEEMTGLVCRGDRVVVMDHGGATFRSEDGGDTWAEIPDPDAAVLQHLGTNTLQDLALSPDGAVLYAAVADHGLYRRGL